MKIELVSGVVLVILESDKLMELGVIDLCVLLIVG